MVPALNARPEEFHAAAKRVLEKGYRALKFDPFGAGYYELSYEEKLKSVELVEAVRDAVGPDVEILVEMHGRFSPYMAIEIAAELEQYQPSWVEEPVPPDNIAALAKAADQIKLPVATGERLHNKYEYRELINLQAADILQPGYYPDWRLLGNQENRSNGGHVLYDCCAA